MADYKDPENTLLIETTKGPVVIEMRPDLAPNHVAHIKKLAREGVYDGIVFHRVIDGFMAQTGDVNGNGADTSRTGTGGSKYPNLKQEFNAEPHVRGIASMARSQNPDSANSQFFIVLRRRPLPRHAVHGLGQGDRGHGERRQDQARRAGARSGQDGLGQGRRRRRNDAASPPSPVLGGARRVPGAGDRVGHLRDARRRGEFRLSRRARPGRAVDRRPQHLGRREGLGQRRRPMVRAIRCSVGQAFEDRHCGP